MSFIPKTGKPKVKCGYKTLYISEELVERVDKIAFQFDTSFNNVVISMIEQCLSEDGEEPNNN